MTADLQPRPFGIPGVMLQPGDHVCALYLGTAERDAIILPFLREGLRLGEKCICVLDTTPPSDVLSAIGHGIDVHGSVASEQFMVCGCAEAYLRSGAFSGDDMLECWDGCIGEAIGGGYRFARVTGEMPRTLRDPSERAAFFRYESELNRFLPRYPQALLCLYDLSLFGGGVLVDLLKTHPKLLVGGRLLENPYCLTPEEYLATEG
jgi:hypothetical protein